MKKLFLFLLFLPVFHFCQININANLLETNFGGDSDPKEIIKVGNKIFFTALGINQNISSNRRIYVKENLTTEAKYIEINNSQYNSISIIGKLGSIVIFTLETNGFANKQIWRTDGTNSGTYLVKTIENSSNYSLNNIKFTNDKFFFTIPDGNLTALWASDGTAANTLQVNSFSFPSNFVILNGNLLFSLQNSTLGATQIYKSDGTTSGTSAIVTFPTTVNSVNGFITSDSFCYFLQTENFSDYKLCKVDVAGNVNVIKQLTQYQYTIRGGYINGKFIFFNRENNTTNGFVMNIYDESNNTLSILNNNDQNVYDVIAFKNKIYYLSIDYNNNNEWMISDGTSVGTKTLSSVFNETGLYPIKKTEDSQYLVLTNNSDLFLADGTSVLKKIVKESSTFSFTNQADFTFYDNSNVIFSGNNDENGTELFFFNNSETKLLEDINHTLNGTITNPIELNNKLVYFGSSYKSGMEPFVSDGTIAGTKILKDINPSSYSGSVFYGDNPTFFKNGNKLFFRCSNGNAPNEPCVTDGTESGTRLIKKLGIYTQGSLPEDPYFMSLNDNEVLFSADGNGNNSWGDYNLWKTDGTESGTVLIHSVYPAKGSFDQKISSANINGWVYFTGQATLNDDLGIWKTDGTTAGTQPVKTFVGPNNVVLFPKIIAQYNNKIFIMTTHWSTTQDLYVYDVSTNTSTFLQTRPLGELDIHANKMNFIGFEKIITLDMNTLQFTENIYNPGAASWNSSLQYKQCEDNLFLYNYTTNGGKLFTINNQVNQPIQLSHLKITANTCIDNKMLYTAYASNFTSENVMKITDGTSTTDVNMFLNNQPVDLSYSLNNIFGFYKIQDKLFFHGQLFQLNMAGHELYSISDWNQFLNTSDTKFSSKNAVDLITLFPNPASHFIKIKTADKIKIMNVSAYDINGRKIILTSQNNTFTDFNISNLPTGIYIMKIETNEGVVSKKFVKK
ncbi:T9SS type A sorting domain-containing protein [Chryseobacterium sp. C39-AII1]|uniref:T9SS type A sorting domain-containing protein n=1 Tax=Chryseobacterium sp. C39-AII1 TaxID=3080332 RepID=UPI003207BD7A